MTVKAELRKLGLHFVVVDLGEVELMDDISHKDRELLKVALSHSGIELMEDKKAVLIEKIKNTIIDMVHYPSETIKLKFSAFISEKLKYDYTYLSNIFSQVQGISIAQFITALKVERIKELIIYDELNITEIAFLMNYSSVAHLSNQFKKETGLTPTQFKKMGNKRRVSIEDIGKPD
jgi:AraC-like DNA-binding protein